MRYTTEMFSEWLSEAITQSNISQAELARQMTSKLGRSIDRAAVNKMTKGDRSISAEEMLAIIRITGANLPSAFASALREQAAATEADRPGLSENQARVVRLVFQAFLGWAMGDPILRNKIKDPAYQSALSRIAAQYAASRQVHEAAARGDDAASDLVRLSLEISRD